MQYQIQSPPSFSQWIWPIVVACIITALFFGLFIWYDTKEYADFSLAATAPTLVIPSSIVALISGFANWIYDYQHPEGSDRVWVKTPTTVLERSICVLGGVTMICLFPFVGIIIYSGLMWLAFL